MLDTIGTFGFLKILSIFIVVQDILIQKYMIL